MLRICYREMPPLTDMTSRGPSLFRFGACARMLNLCSIRVEIWGLFGNYKLGFLVGKPIFPSSFLSYAFGRLKKNYFFSLALHGNG